MEIKDFLWLMWRGAKFWLLGLLLGVALGVAASILQPPDYEASTKVLVNRPRQQTTSVDLLPLSEDQLVSTNALMVKTKPVLDEASYELGVKINPDNITVTVLPNTMVIQIKVQGRDPKQAAAIANMLVQILIKENQDILEQRYVATESALKEQIDAVQKQIDNLQEQYTHLNDANIQEQLRLVNQQIDLLKSSIASLEQDINNFPIVLSVSDRAALAQRQAELEQQRSLLNLYQQIQVNLTFAGQALPGGTRPIPPLINIQSNIDLYQKIYLSLQNSLEANRSEQKLNTPDVLQIDPAVTPKTPVRPMPALYVFLGALVGFSLAVGAILLTDHLYNPLKSAAQVEKALGLLVLGSISQPAQPANGMVSLAAPATTAAEAFRSLGAAIDTTCGEGKLGTLMIVNAATGEPRTAISANLAVSYAQQGRPVTLIDGDIGHPYLHALFGRKNQSGLANLVDDAQELPDIGQCVEEARDLTLVAAGSTINHTARWMNAEKWASVFSKFRKPRGLIIVDGASPETADAQTLASKADGILLVVRAGQTSADSVEQTMRRFKLGGARILGVVLYRGRSTRRLHAPKFSWKRMRPRRKEEPATSASTIDEAKTPPS